MVPQRKGTRILQKALRRALCLCGIPDRQRLWEFPGVCYQCGRSARQHFWYCRKRRSQVMVKWAAIILCFDIWLWSHVVRLMVK